jgi:hypothetical protein
MGFDMTDDFRKIMEQQSKRVAAYLEQQTALGWRYAERTWQTTKIKQAIEGIDDLSHMLCDDGYCSSVFCMTCRKRKQDSLYRQYKERVVRFRNDDEAREHLRYATILEGLVPLSLDEGIIGDESEIKNVEQSVESFRKKLKSIDRYFRTNNIWARGTIHLELINMELFRFASLSGRITTKQKTLTDLENHFRHNADYSVLVHSHILFDLNGIDDKEFRNHLRNKWNITDRQVDVTRLTKYYIDNERFSEHSIDDAIRNIANYGYNGSNGKLSFATNWGSSRKVYSKQQRKDALGKINVYVEGIKGLDTLDEQMNKGQVRVLIRLHNRFTDNGRGLLVSIL